MSKYQSEEGFTPQAKKLLTILALITIGLVLFFTRSSWTPLITRLIPGSQATQPASPAQPGQPNQPGQTTQTPDLPGQEPNSQSDLPVIRVGGPSFGAYFNAILALQQNQDNTHYRLEYIPLEFPVEDPLHPGQTIMLPIRSLDGSKFYTGSEGDQTEMMQDGTLDVLMNTSDVIALGKVGRWFTDIGVSDGADKTIAYKVGVAGCPGKAITRVNDLVGCVIAVSPNAVGQFQILSIMSAARIDPNSVTWLTGEINDQGNFQEYSVEDACQAFADGKADAVAGWIPCVDDVQSDKTLELATSVWLRNISDTLIVSNRANNDPVKSEATFWFLVNWFYGMKVQQENLKLAGETTANWQYVYTDTDGQDPDLSGTYPTNDWTYVYPESAEADMHAWNDTYGQAGLDANLLLITDTKPLLQRFVDDLDIWVYGGVKTNAVADPNSYIEPKYLLRLADYVKDHPELRPRGGTTLPNTSYVPFQIVPTNPRDVGQLIDLPTAVEVGCVDQLNFKPGEDFLRPNTVDYDNFVACIQNLQKFVSQTKNVTILVTGSAAHWCGYTPEYVSDFALQRAKYVQYAMVQGAGIPAPFITIDKHVGTFTCDAAVNQQDRWVRIEVKYDTSMR